MDSTVEKILVWLVATVFLATVLLTTASLAKAQQTSKVPRIGFLFSLSPAVNTDRIEAFRQGMRDLGYVEGKNVVVEYRYAEGKLDRLSELAPNWRV
jgi:putative tryptophan/tyrosine transport system substrate-binding protein